MSTVDDIETERVTRKWGLYEALSAFAEAGPETVAERLGGLYHPDAQWEGPTLSTR